MYKHKKLELTSFLAQLSETAAMFTQNLSPEWGSFQQTGIPIQNISGIQRLNVYEG